MSIHFQSLCSSEIFRIYRFYILDYRTQRLIGLNLRRKHIFVRVCTTRVHDKTNNEITDA